VSAGRAEIGAVQNRLQVTIANLGTARENLSAANSRIRDVDVASESAELTKNNILMQAGVSVLAQANQQPSLALSLLG
jgi:flagellin